MEQVQISQAGVTRDTCSSRKPEISVT